MGERVGDSPATKAAKRGNSIRRLLYLATLSSYIGVPSGREEVKLEEQVLVTKNGPEFLSNFPFDEELLN